MLKFLNNRSETLVVMVGAGVGLAAVIGTIRFVKGWSLKPLIYLALAPTILLTLYAWSNPDLRTILGLAWDCDRNYRTCYRSISVIARIGIAASAGKGDSSLQDCARTMASLFPIIAVLTLAIYVSQNISVEEIIASASTLQNVSSEEISKWSQTPYAEIIGGIRAILPLVIFLMFVLFIILRSKLPNNLVTTYGLALSIIGMCL